ncbi:hypothetical protein GQ53DRAFT_769404 [Thozetella sp. PMI_491]|nr:hypothetical protein GQ53DRAFT_769404 [Thozetella sp. PMI_491]
MMYSAAASLFLAAAVGAQSIATVTYFSSTGCTGTADHEAIFGTPNLCQSLDTVLGSVKTVNVTSVEEGCTVHFYTDAACTQGDTIGVLNNCEEANSPFIRTNVIC